MRQKGRQECLPHCFQFAKTFLLPRIACLQLRGFGDHVGVFAFDALEVGPPLHVAHLSEGFEDGAEEGPAEDAEYPRQ